MWLRKERKTKVRKPENNAVKVISVPRHSDGRKGANMNKFQPLTSRNVTSKLSMLLNE